MGRAWVVEESLGQEWGHLASTSPSVTSLPIKGAAFRQVRKLSLKSALCPSMNHQLFGNIDWFQSTPLGVRAFRARRHDRRQQGRQPG